MTPLFILMPHRGEFVMPAEALVIIVLVAVVPWVVMSFTFTCLVMWRDWRQSETKKEKALFGVRLFSIVALTTVLMFLSESGIIG